MLGAVGLRECRTYPGRDGLEVRRRCHLCGMMSQRFSGPDRDDMKMQMRHSLTGAASRELHDAQARHLQPDADRPGDALGHPNAFDRTLRRHIEYGFSGLPADNERMAHGLWHHIHEGQRMRIFRQLHARQLATKYFCENVVGIVGHGEV